MPAREVPGPREVVERQHLARAGVLQAEQTGACEVIVVRRLQHRRHAIEIQGAVGLEVDRLGLDAAEHRRPPALVLEGVGFLTGHVLVASFAVGEHSDEVALGAARREDRRLVSHQLRRRRFQAVDAGILAHHVVADFGLRHRDPHRGSWAGDGIASQIDHVADLGWVCRSIAAGRCGVHAGASTFG